MNKKDKFLTIGQFAAMHGINKKTLMWYDEIGLFKPASINPEMDTAVIPTIKVPFWKQSSCFGNWTFLFLKYKIS